jgi:3-oxoacyl-[acyl-carrier-protein] synthase-3
VPHPITAPQGARHARILGVGGYRPRRVVPNSEIVDRISSSDEWVRARTGIRARRWAGEGESVVDMSTAAAGKALAAAGVAPEDVGFVMIATVTHPHQIPAAAPEVATRLGAVNAAAMDISAACAGFCYGLALANDMVRGGSARYVVVIGCERLSDFTDLDDRGTAFLFADGAGAAVVGPSDTPGIGPVVWGAEGDKRDLIHQTHSWLEVRDDRAVEFPTFHMAGQSVFRWAVWEMAPVAERALEAAGLTPADLDVFIPHQANMRIIDALLKKLDLPEGIPVARDIAEMGNTSAASIPLAMEHMLETGEAASGDNALLIAFGAGLVYAALVVTLP